MSVATELTRIQNAKASLKTKLNAKNDQQHQITTQTIDDYDDFVDSIETPNLQSKSIEITTNETQTVSPDSGYNGLSSVEITTNVSGGGQTPDSLYSFNQLGQIFFDSFETYIRSNLSQYPVYTQNSLTLYIPAANAQYYIIHKKANGKYRIIWSVGYAYACVWASNSVGFTKFHTHGYTGVNKYDTIPTLKNEIFEVGMFDNLAPIGTFYYSGDYDTIQEIIDQITDPNGTITYSSWNTSCGFNATLETPYEIAYSNVPVLDRRSSNSFSLLMSQILSNDETYVVKQ